MNKTYLFITTTNYTDGRLTGAHRRLLELAEGLSKSNKVIFISNKIPQMEKNPNVKIIEINILNIAKLPRHINNIIMLVRELKKHKKSIQYDYAIAFSTIYAMCFVLAGYKNIVSFFREDLIGYLKCIGSTKLKLKYFKMQERIAVKHSEKIIVQCKNDKETLIQRNYKYNNEIEKKVLIQINNVNASWMSGVSRTKDIGTNKDIMILFLGNFNDRRKGHDYLLSTVARMLDENIMVKLLVAGGGKELEKFKLMYCEYEKIVFMDHINSAETKKLLASSDILIVPSYIDSCPNTVLEGLNAGMAVYGAATGGIPDLLLDSKYMFSPSEDALYFFLKNKLINREFIFDAAQEKTIKDRLTFDWAKRIEDIVENA